MSIYYLKRKFVPVILMSFIFIFCLGATSFAGTDCYEVEAGTYYNPTNITGAPAGTSWVVTGNDSNIYMYDFETFYNFENTVEILKGTTPNGSTIEKGFGVCSENIFPDPQPDGVFLDPVGDIIINDSVPNEAAVLLTNDGDVIVTFQGENTALASPSPEATHVEEGECKDVTSESSIGLGQWLCINDRDDTNWVTEGLIEKATWQNGTACRTGWSPHQVNDIDTACKAASWFASNSLGDCCGKCPKKEESCRWNGFPKDVYVKTADTCTAKLTQPCKCK